MSAGYVADTHAIIFYAAGEEKRLGRQAREAFRALREGECFIYVPAPVVMETWLLSRTGILRLKTSLNAWWEDLEDAGFVHEDMGQNDVLAAAALDWAHQDMWDRLIVAMAHRLDVPLLSRDQAVTEFAERTRHIDVVW